MPGSLGRDMQLGENFKRLGMNSIGLELYLPGQDLRLFQVMFPFKNAESKPLAPRLRSCLQRAIRSPSRFPTLLWLFTVGFGGVKLLGTSMSRRILKLQADDKVREQIYYPSEDDLSAINASCAPLFPGKFCATSRGSSSPSHP